MNSEVIAVLAGLLYATAAGLDVWAGRYGYGLMWASYGTANVGIILSMRGI